MNLTPRKLNIYLFFKLPAAYLCGVRARSISDTSCVTTVTYRWINQNPFNSMFWAVQGMAAELTTGAMVMKQIKESGQPISMLVAKNNATFSKKAIGKITFECNEGVLIKTAIETSIKTGEGQTVRLESIGRNSEGVEVSRFNFEWTLKVRTTS